MEYRSRPVCTIEYHDPYLFTVLFQLPPLKSKALAGSNVTTKASQLGQNLSVTINGVAVLLCVGDLDFEKSSTKDQIEETASFTLDAMFLKFTRPDKGLIT